MTVTAEISLNPLSEDYAAIVTSFCEELLNYEQLAIQVGGLSTRIIGDLPEVLSAIESVLLPVFQQHKAVFHLKMAPGNHTEDGLPDSLR